jgi:hypothetical protein
MRFPSQPHANADRLTAIQLRVDGDLTARLLCGAPFSIVGGEDGEIAVLPVGRVAAYLVVRRRTTGLYVFRTAGGGDRTRVPGSASLFACSFRAGGARPPSGSATSSAS